MNRLRSWLVNSLLVLGALAVALVVTELGLRVMSPQPTGLSHQDRYGLALHWPGIVRHLPQFGTTASFNSAGMRDREHPLEKPPGVYRILVLGDSFMEALQVDFEASLPSLLEHELARQTGRQIEVVNAGVSGWGTGDELRYLTQYGLQYQPDLVLVAMTLHNDVSDNLREDWYALHDSSLVDQPRMPMSPLRYRFVLLKGFLATRFQTYQLWRKVRHAGEIKRVAAELNSHIVELFRDPTPKRIEQGFKLTDLLLSRIDSVTRAHGGRTALVLLPLIVQLSDQAFARFVMAAGTNAKEMQSQKPQHHMMNTADRLGIPAIDLLPAFRQWVTDGGASLYLQSDGHWTNAGHKLAADVVAKDLLSAGVLH